MAENSLRFRYAIKPSHPSTTLAVRNPSIQHFRETINGREYAIEVGRALDGGWRASLVRAAGVPTALMPFYSATPREARDRLTGWLAAAHRSAAPVPAAKTRA
ncbi:MAG: hypothetical protein F4W89_05520 [Acidobacteria bacterium]|nr:hypothetical protein [Acidobacteriota bacterium]